MTPEMSFKKCRNGLQAQDAAVAQRKVEEGVGWLGGPRRLSGRGNFCLNRAAEGDSQVNKGEQDS